MHVLSLLLVVAPTVHGFGWVADQAGVDPSLLREGRYASQKRQTTCPYNSNHQPAAPYTSQFPYTGAKDGLRGTGKGGIKVPADGDTAHSFQAPTSNDIRGPCPGLNTAANHNFLPRDGIATYTDLVDMQQNLWNLDYDVAVILAVMGITTTGDPLSGKVSIGCEATSRTATSLLSGLLGVEPGLNAHDKFEMDVSLTRNDYYQDPDMDNHSFNGTLFAEMKAYADKFSGGKFDANALAAYKSQRYDESLQHNGKFVFEPTGLVLYGAATFLYELFASFGPEGVPDLATIASIFGAEADSSAPGGWKHVPEKLPDNWFNRRDSYKLDDLVVKILAIFTPYPKLFGGNAGVNNFNALPGTVGIITNGKLPDTATGQDIMCLFYLFVTANVASSISNVLNWAVGKLNPVFDGRGCVL